MSALDTQVGGSHYREGGIQPIQYIEANSLQFLEASVVKRVTRHNRATGKGKQDIEKAIHELQLLLELRYAEPVAQEVRVDAGELGTIVVPNATIGPVPESTFQPEWPKDEQRIDAIGQNGNGGEHYAQLADCIHRWTAAGVDMLICAKCGDKS